MGRDECEAWNWNTVLSGLLLTEMLLHPEASASRLLPQSAFWHRQHSVKRPAELSTTGRWFQIPQNRNAMLQWTSAHERLLPPEASASSAFWHKHGVRGCVGRVECKAWNWNTVLKGLLPTGRLPPRGFCLKVPSGTNSAV